MTDVDIIQVIVPPHIQQPLREWLSSRGLTLFPIPVEDDLPTYGIGFPDPDEQEPCRAHPDDCPNGPGPHAYYNPPEFEGRPPCCRQPGEPETPPGELLEELF